MMTREEAIQNIKKLIGFSDTLDESISTLFPELKESEDERIRKDLIKYLESDRDCQPCQDVSFYDSSIAWLEKQGNIDFEAYENAEKEKYDFVSGKFIECRKSFNEFKEDNSYWFEYVGNDTYIGRSDNILNKKFHITPRQLYRLFTQEHCPKEDSVSEGNKECLNLPHFTFDDVLALQCCMETVKKVQKDEKLYEALLLLHDKVHDAYHFEKQKKQKPVEWSDTDNIGWDEAFACVTRAEKAAKNEEELQNAVTAEKWLKEIKSKYYVHPVKQEWSEEDRRKLNRIYDILGYAADDKGFLTSKRIIGDKEAIELQDFLKFLRPSWKPSDGQMAELNKVRTLNPGLDALYQQLKNM